MLVIVQPAVVEQLGKTDNPVHRRANFMAHIGKKCRLGGGGGFGVSKSLTNFPFFLHQFAGFDFHFMTNIGFASGINEHLNDDGKRQNHASQQNQKGFLGADAGFQFRRTFPDNRPGLPHDRKAPGDGKERLPLRRFAAIACEYQVGRTRLLVVIYFYIKVLVLTFCEASHEARSDKRSIYPSAKSSPAHLGGFRYSASLIHWPQQQETAASGVVLHESDPPCDRWFACVSCMIGCFAAIFLEPDIQTDGFPVHVHRFDIGDGQDFRGVGDGVDGDVPDTPVASEFQIFFYLGSRNGHDEANAIDAGKRFFDIQNIYIGSPFLERNNVRRFEQGRTAIKALPV